MSNIEDTEPPLNFSQTSAINERQIKKAKTRRRRDDEVEEVIVQLIMRNPEGRRWMWNQLAFCQMWHENRNTEYGVMAFDKGLRNYGLKLHNSVLRSSPQEYLMMMKEHSAVFIKPKEPTDGGSDANDPDE